MADPPTSVRHAFDRLAEWLAKHAPAMRESLLPPAPEARLEALAADFRCVVPPSFVELYRCAGGQRDDAPAGLFEGYYFMPLDGVDGVMTAWDQMIDMAERGAAHASKDLYAFAKDFGGNVLCVEGCSGVILEIDEGEQRKLADDMAHLLASMQEDLEHRRVQGKAGPGAASHARGGPTAGPSAPRDQAELFEIVFDASRQRAPGERVTHSLFTALGIEAVVVPLSEVAQREHGMAVRLIPASDDVSVVGVDRLVDGAGRPLQAEIGHCSGGGKPGYVVYVASPSPLPAQCRLHVRLQRAQSE